LGTGGNRNWHENSSLTPRTRAAKLKIGRRPVEHQERRMGSVDVVDEIGGGMGNESLHGSALGQVLRSAVAHGLALNRVGARQGRFEQRGRNRKAQGNALGIRSE
jgi:hypothetical protein